MQVLYQTEECLRSSDARLLKVSLLPDSAHRYIGQTLAACCEEPTTMANIQDYKPGPETAGQSGDNQGLSNLPQADSESVEELLEEGQAFEAAVVSGVENAPDADVSEVTTKEVPEDDVPLEYQKREQD
jgi:hypothetical protein